MKTMTKRIFTAVLSILLVNIAVRADDADDYSKFAEETREWVYALDIPAFNIREIPDKYKNESAVYIAVYNDLSILRNTTPTRLPGTLIVSSDKLVEQRMLDRTLVYINDKAALDEFSEYDFLTSVTSKHGLSQRNSRVVMGVKVIKPDGTENVIDTDDYVEVKEGKKGEKVRRKLAVPGLEVGDIIDRFVYISTDIHNDHPDPMMFIMREEYPVMNYSIHWLIDATLASSYRLLNGAPEFTSSKDRANRFHLDMELTDLPARPRLFYDDMLQSPGVKLYVFNPDAEPFIPKSSNVVGHCGEPFSFWVRQEWWNLKQKYTYDDAAKDFLKSALKNGGKAPAALRDALKSGNKSLTEVTDCAYNLMVFAHFMSDEKMHPLLFDIRMQTLLRDLVGDSLQAVITTPSYVERVDEVLSIFGLTTGSALPDGSRYYFPPAAYMSPSEIHPAYSGRVALKYPLTKVGNITEEGDTAFFNLPDYRSRENRKRTDVNVSIDETDLVIKRRTTCSGITKLPMMPLLNGEDIVNAYLDYFKDWGLDIAIKENRKKNADRMARYADSRVEQMEDFESEVKSYNSDVSVDSVKGKIVSAGINPKSPRLVYDVEYTAHDLVRRAGNNIVLNVGQLLESDRELLDKDRQREDIIISRGAREYITHIEVELPEGTRVSEKSLEALNSSVGNSAGLFGSTAKVEGDKLIIDVIYRYNRRFLPATSWPDMVELIDDANAWQSKTILLEQ